MTLTLEMFRGFEWQQRLLEIDFISSTSWVFDTSPNPRTGAGSLRIGSAAHYAGFFLAGGRQKQLTVHLKPGTDFNDAGPIVRFMAGAWSDAALQFYIRFVDVDGYLGIYDYPSATLLSGLSAQPLVPSTYVKVGIDYNLSATGWIVLDLDGVIQCVYEGDLSSKTTPDRFGLQGAQNSWNTFYDDLTVWDTAGEVAYAVTQDRRYFLQKPVADGSLLEWTPTPAGDHFAQVDDPAAHDSNTTYLESDTALLEERLLVSSPVVPADWHIDFVQPVAIALKTDGGAPTTVSLGLRQGGITDQAAAVGMASSYAIVEGDRQATSPDGSAWTPAILDATEFVIRHES